MINAIVMVIFLLQVIVSLLVMVLVPDQNWSRSLIPVPVPSYFGSRPWSGPGPVIFLVPAFVPDGSRSKFLVPSHSAQRYGDTGFKDYITFKSQTSDFGLAKIKLTFRMLGPIVLYCPKESHNFKM